LRNQSKPIVPIDHSVQQEGCNLGQLFKVFERSHQLSGLSGPEHMLSGEASYQVLLILLILVVVALNDKIDKAFESRVGDHGLIDELNLEKFDWSSGGLRSSRGRRRICGIELGLLGLLLLEENRVCSEGESKQACLVNGLEKSVGIFSCRWVPVGLTIKLDAEEAGLDIKFTLTCNGSVFCNLEQVLKY